MTLDYEKMLNEVYSKLPVKTFKQERLEIPKPSCAVSGSRTLLNNFVEICDVLNRNPTHCLRFLSREMATAGSIDGSHAVFQGKFECEFLERLIKRYIDEFVTCPVCKRPDTKIVKEKRLNFLVCEACGARSPVRPV
ncbi:MAG: translation initiation factor IF-2 subunit beta [Candidatus Bathyarchaeia archaeon]